MCIKLGSTFSEKLRLLPLTMFIFRHFRRIIFDGLGNLLNMIKQLIIGRSHESLAISHAQSCSIFGSGPINFLSIEIYLKHIDIFKFILLIVYWLIKVMNIFPGSFIWLMHFSRLGLLRRHQFTLKLFLLFLIVFFFYNIFLNDLWRCYNIIFNNLIILDWNFVLIWVIYFNLTNLTLYLI